MRAGTLCITLLACLVVAAPAQAIEQTLVASDGQEDDYFGGSVAVDGDTAVVAATTNFAKSAFVYVFTRDGDVWTQTARLQGSDTETGDRFGVNVAIQGDTIVVGAPQHPNGADNLQAGAVYLFDRTGAPNREERAKLTLPASTPKNAVFGGGVAIDGDVIAASAPGEGGLPNTDPNGPRGGYGAVYLFDRSAETGDAPKARLLAQDGSLGDGLGSNGALAMDGGTVVAGAYTKHDKPADGPYNRGAAYTFDATATGAGTSTDKLLASDGLALDQFGFSVDVDDETIVVGANRDSLTNPTRSYVGSAYVFENADDHDQLSKLVTSDGLSEDRVGWDVAVGGAQIAVAADLDDHGTASSTVGAGTVYLYPRSSTDGERSETSRFISATPTRFGSFGSDVDIDGTTLIAGEDGSTVGNNDNQGSARISFISATKPACSDGGDNDGDGKIDFPADPGCTSVDDTSEADPPPPPPSQGGSGQGGSAQGNAGGGSPPGVKPTETDDGSKAPRINRPQTMPPVTPGKKNEIRFATVWDCVDQPKDDAPCKAYGWVEIAFVVWDSAKKKPVRIGSTRTTIPSGGKKPVTMRLTKKAYKLLLRKKKLKAKVKLQLSRAGQRTATSSFSVTIKAPKKKKKR